MALEVCYGLESLVDQGLKSGVNKAEEASGRLTHQGYDYVKGKAREAGIPTSPGEAAQMVKAEISRRFNLPPLPSPSQIPKFVADQISKEMGIPIPTEISADSLLALANKIPNLPFPLPVPFPSNVKQALEYGLKTAAQLLGPQALAAIGLGSVVPGIGNLIGIGFAFASMIAAALKRPPYKQTYACIPAKAFIQQFKYLPHVGKSERTFGQNNISALSMAYSQAVLSESRSCYSGKVCTNPVVLGVEGSRRPGGGGHAILKEGQWLLKDYNETSVLQCGTDSEYRIRHVLFPLVYGKTQTLTLPQVQAALAMFDYVAQHGGKLEQESQKYVGELRTRLQQFQRMMADHATLMKLPPPASTADRAALSRFGGLVFKLAQDMGREMQTAAVAAQMAGYRPTGEVYSPFWFQKNLEQFALAASILTQLQALSAAVLKRDNELTGRKTCARGDVACWAEKTKRWQASERQEGRTAPAPAPAPKPPTPPPPHVVAAAKRIPPTAPPHVKAAAKRVLNLVESKPAPHVIAAAKRVPHTAPAHIKDAAKRVLHKAEQASKKFKVSASIIESTKMPEIFQLFG